ncbi:MAG TPA: DUF2961 domain-containing protein [Abditibacterium sp.]
MAQFIKGHNARTLWSGASIAVFLFCSPSRAQVPLDTLAQAPTLPPFRWFASTDPKNQNDDYFLIKPGETRRVPLAAGRLERLWSTSLFPDQLDLVLEAGPRRRQLLLSGGRAVRGLLENKAYIFFPALKGDSLSKLDQGATLIATNHAKEPSKWYFQAAVRPPSPALTVPVAKEASRRLFPISLAPGEQKVVEKWDSPGQIYEFSVAADLTGAQTFRNLRFKASFDGQSAVDAPLMSLAGQIEGEELIRNAVAEFDGSRLVLRWPMPFQSAEISLKNEGDKPLKLDVGARVSQFERAPSPFRFCAFQNSATPKNGRPVEILKLKGEGAFVGLALHQAPLPDATRRTFAYLEGNETLVADEKTFEGTGTEDFFSSAWYYPDKPFLHPFEGMTQKIAAPPSVAAYRWMIPDAVPFKKSFRFDFEHGNGNNAENIVWKWVAVWYQKPPLALPVAASSDAPATSDTNAAPVAADERWKIALAIGAGIVLGVVSRLLKRRRA